MFRSFVNVSKFVIFNCLLIQFFKLPVNKIRTNNPIILNVLSPFLYVKLLFFSTKLCKISLFIKIFIFFNFPYIVSDFMFVFLVKTVDLSLSFFILYFDRRLSNFYRAVVTTWRWFSSRTFLFFFLFRNLILFFLLHFLFFFWTWIALSLIHHTHWFWSFKFNLSRFLLLSWWLNLLFFFRFWLNRFWLNFRFRRR